MSAWKPSEPDSSKGGRDPAPPRPVTEAKPSARPKATIKAFELAVEPDGGGDPYNRTGQFLVEELKKYQE